jgi:hypothetical protein
VKYKGSKCKGCRTPVLQGATICGRCGAKLSMPMPHKLLLGGGSIIVATLFALASRGPDPAELEYRPPRPQAGSLACADGTPGCPTAWTAGQPATCTRTADKLDCPQP